MVPLWHVHSCALLLVMLPRRVADPRSAKPPLGALPVRVWFMKGWGLSLVPFLFSNFHFLLRLWTLSDLFCFLRPLPAFRMLSRSVFRGQPQKGSRCEFLQDLHAQNTPAFAPKLPQNVFGGDMLGFCIHIVGVNQHIGIDEGPTVHVILPGWLEYRLPSESLGQGAPRPGARRVRILLPRPPGFQSAAPAIR